MARIPNLLVCFLIGEVVAGPPSYDLDLWLATAMLGITFPLLIIFADFFQFCSLTKPDAEQEQN